MRGLFRLLRIFIVARKLYAVRIRREDDIKRVIIEEYDLRPPLEKIIEIMSEFKQRLHPSENRLTANVDYCIKMV